MSTKFGRVGRHKFHGDAKRFEVLAEFVVQNFQGKAKRVADVGGGQGMLCRILSKKYNFDCEVIDPRGFPLVGVKNRVEEYKSEMADYYDLIVGLHPDEALRDVVESARVRPIVLIPCCNFWDKTKKLGRDALLEKIKNYLKENKISLKEVEFDFEGPKNIGIVTSI